MCPSCARAHGALFRFDQRHQILRREGPPVFSRAAAIDSCRQTPEIQRWWRDHALQEVNATAQALPREHTPEDRLMDALIVEFGEFCAFVNNACTGSLRISSTEQCLKRTLPLIARPKSGTYHREKEQFVQLVLRRFDAYERLSHGSLIGGIYGVARSSGTADFWDRVTVQPWEADWERLTTGRELLLK